jgi:hypothetical protein
LKTLPIHIAKIDFNTISTTTTDTNIELRPNGNGTLNINSNWNAFLLQQMKAYDLLHGTIQNQVTVTSANNLEWDISVNRDQIEYSSDRRAAKQVGKHCSIRTRFFSRGRHIANIRISKMGHTGIGICNKAFGIIGWIGGCSMSYGTWDNNVAQFSQNCLKTAKQILTVEGDIVTCDLDMDEGTFSWAINGQYLSDDFDYKIKGGVGAGQQWAIAASLWATDDQVEIVQYKYLS